MADINKSALLILNEDKTKFLVNRKLKDGVLSDWLMPGGKIEPGETIDKSLVREIKEELDCNLDSDSLEFICEYEGPAANQPGKFVNIKLYSGSIIGEPVASSEIFSLGWLGKDDQENMEASEIIRTKIIPDIIERKILK